MLVVRKFTLIVFRSAATHVDFVFAIFYVINLLYNFGTCKNNSLTNSRGETEYKIVIDGKYRSVYVCAWRFGGLILKFGENVKRVWIAKII